jgi:hypothetical protein
VPESDSEKADRLARELRSLQREFDEFKLSIERKNAEANASAALGLEKRAANAEASAKRHADRLAVLELVRTCFQVR